MSTPDAAGTAGAAAWDDEPRTWIVTLAARAAFRFTERQQITIVASAATTEPVAGIRLRNHVCWAGGDHSQGAPTFVGAFVAEAAGTYSNVSDAVAELANFASPYFQVLALTANAGVEEPEDLIAYAPPRDPSDPGEFVIQRHSQARAPAARLRSLKAADVMTVLQLLQDHPHHERLQRAMAHYRMALNELDPLNRVLSAESLWMVVENMTSVVLDRLRADHELPQTPEGKHQLALTLGFAPKAIGQEARMIRWLQRLRLLNPAMLKRDNTHLGALDRHIRLEILLGGDRECYKQLKEMSDGFEHGFMSFGDVKEKSAVADRAFTHLRRAILGEIGVDATSALLAARFDDPLGVWRPVLEAEGTYTDTAGKRVDLTPENFNEAWPDPPGLSLVPLVEAVVDHADETRTITLQVNGTAAGLTDTQTAQLLETRWLSPATSQGKVIDSEVTVRINGEIVQDALVVDPG